ncbi:MAG: hypothetical protein NT031_03425 [Planctomycetota bacterium]|nr:hypothetical protein [Planctomycetota bacterium]
MELLILLVLIVANIIVDTVCRSAPPKSWAATLLIVILVPDALAILVTLKYALLLHQGKLDGPGQPDHPSRDGDLLGIPLAALPLLFPFLPCKTAALQTPVTSPHLFALSEQVLTLDTRRVLVRVPVNPRGVFEYFTGLSKVSFYGKVTAEQTNDCSPTPGNS